MRRSPIRLDQGDGLVRHPVAEARGQRPEVALDRGVPYVDLRPGGLQAQGLQRTRGGGGVSGGLRGERGDPARERGEPVPEAERAAGDRHAAVDAVHLPFQCGPGS